jgi:hypothetical protein
MISRYRDRRLAGRRAHGLLIVAFVIIFALGGAVQSLCQKPEAEASLRERIGAFWTTMEKADFAAAAEFIHPESRGTFRDRMGKSRSGAWRIDKLDFNEAFTVCEATVAVRRELPFAAGAALDWPMHNTWVLEQGQWFLKIPWDKDENPIVKMFREQEQVAAQRTTEIAPAPKTAAPRPSGDAFVNSIDRFTADMANPTVLHFGEKATFKFHYRNNTNAPIRIVSALADCHCTGVRREGYPELAPGEVGTLEITLDTFGLPLGPVDKNIQVQFSDLKIPLNLHLGVENRPNFIIEPARIDFGSLRSGATGELRIKLKNGSGQTVSVIGVIHADTLLKIEVEKKVAAPNEEIVLALRYDAGKPGDVMDAISLRLDLPAEPLINIPVRGKVVPK